ncbi:MAG: putative photosynthetic complex assembly protein PuhE [Steroidobacteraceae bacterium]|jgi:putative photosynthetic complex assembly protein 2|nr:putative photosynthetic complex assembly protein PuhE [Steroidobacteraceae bacterium]
MTELLVPGLCAAFAWWATTGIILWLDHRAPSTYPLTLAGATGLLIVGLYGLAVTAAQPTESGAYLAFASALLVWSWIEVTFLLGYVLGPRRTPCPPLATGWRRFRYAVSAILWHELAILALAVAVLAITRDAVNPVGAWTFLALWVLRTSAKLNLFLGVRNLGADLLPEHLRYLQGYFRKRPMNALFPLSVSAGTAVAAWLYWVAWGALGGADAGFAVTAYALVATLVGLAVLEHWLLVLPTPGDWLWTWALGGRDAKEARPT